MAEWITQYEDSGSLVQVQVWAEDGGWKSTHSVSWRGASMFGNPRSPMRKVFPERHLAIRSAIQRCAATILDERQFYKVPELKKWAEKHKPEPELTGQAELFI